MKFRWIVLTGLALLIPTASGQAQNDPPDPVAAKASIGGKREILLNEKFQPTPQDKAVASAALGNGDGYVSVRYSIGTARQKARLKELIENLALTLPAKFGNSTGTYVINITLTDLAGKVLAKEPILSFQWTKERQLFFIEKTVSEVQKTSWSGTLIDRMLVNATNERLKVALEASLQQDRSLDFDLIKKTAKAFSTSALAAYYPLPAVALPMLDSISGLLADLYARSVKRSLVEEDELVFVPGAPAKRADITFTDGEQQQFAVPVLILTETYDTIFKRDGKLSGGKFDKADLSETIFNNTQLKLSETKNVSIVELISSSSEARFRSTRTMLDSLMSGANYGNADKERDTSIRCGDLYDALHAYLSKSDARAMFWAFLQKYGSQLDKDLCAGSRKTELENIGLGL